MLLLFTGFCWLLLRFSGSWDSLGIASWASQSRWMSIYVAQAQTHWHNLETFTCLFLRRVLGTALWSYCQRFRRYVKFIENPEVFEIRNSRFEVFVTVDNFYFWYSAHREIVMQKQQNTLSNPLCYVEAKMSSLRFRWPSLLLFRPCLYSFLVMVFLMPRKKKIHA